MQVSDLVPKYISTGSEDSSLLFIIYYAAISPRRKIFAVMFSRQHSRSSELLERANGGSAMIKLIPTVKSLGSFLSWPHPVPITNSPGHLMWAVAGVTWATAELSGMACEPWYLHICGHAGPLWPGQPFSPHICWLIGNPNVQDSTGDKRGECVTHSGELTLETKSMWHWS